MFEPLIQKIKRKVEGWFNNLLSLGGKLILLKHILNSIPIYTLSACIPPKSVIAILEKLFNYFFWGHKNRT